MTKKILSVGVIIGRFQVSALHPGHCFLIDQTRKENNALLILVGITGKAPTLRDPLPFSLRKEMIAEKYAKALVLSLPDQTSDKKWSATVDQLIEKHFPKHQITLYASRDSFAPTYFGKFPVKHIPPRPPHSGTKLREKIMRTLRHTDDFRAGIIYAQSLKPLKKKK